ncbi:hypothetical protein CU254_13510 [Amycolatopsis sp. AA4]|uniref:hypothetical protein n=1 Tax=Actinomycetes TaxID=1760 RepID=UPI0001B58018|nr:MULTISPECIES: hypothetical protein [Actinomycetes]ATY11363.1 hypothetical protein CU254_13510 [Amycolatopsis sp. AA4]
MKQLLTLVAVLVLASGCGVRPSGVIPGENAPSGPPNGNLGPTATVYFVLEGKVVPVVRTGVDDVPADRVRALEQGPHEDERASGYTTELPPSFEPIAIGVGEAAIGVNVRELSPNAVAQLVCTILAAGGGGTSGTITLSGGGQKLAPRACGG